MRIQQIEYAIVLVLLCSDCAMEGSCIKGDKESCPSGSSCYAGEDAKEGSLGVCVQEAAAKPEPESESKSEQGLEPKSKPEPELGFLVCSTHIEGLSPNAVSAPLAASGGRLLFGTSLGDTEANSSLYVFDTAACILWGSLHTGAVQGPMVALGGDALVALALGRGGPAERSTARLALIDLEKAKPNFVHDSEMDCVAGSGGSNNNALFDKGLFLMRIGSQHGQGNWRLGAPANAGNASRLLAYEPHVQKTQERCNATMCSCWGNEAPRTPFLLTPMKGIGVDGLRELMTIHETTSIWARAWFFCEICLDWDLQHSEEIQTFKAPSGIAGGGTVQGREQMWLSGNGLQRIYWKEKPEVVLGEHWRTSPAAVDSEGRAYVVVQTSAQSHELQRFAYNAAQGEARECVVGDNSPCKSWQHCMGMGSQAAGTPGLCQGAPEARTSSFVGEPVGSPILGQPLGDKPAEVYVLTTTGTLLVFNADTLALLLEKALDIQVLPSAQPVLMGHVLWAVGSGGEVRGLQVNSDGLNRNAWWPKAFRDNCNTSNLLSGVLPNCF